MTGFFKAAKAHIDIFRIWRGKDAMNFRIFQIAKLISEQPADRRESLTKAALSRVPSEYFNFSSDLMRSVSGMSTKDKERIIIEPMFARAEKLAQSPGMIPSLTLVNLIRQKEFPSELHNLYIQRLTKILETECSHPNATVGSAVSIVQKLIQDIIPPAHKDIRAQLMDATAALIQKTVKGGKTDIDAASRRLTRLANLVPADYVRSPAVTQAGVKPDQTPAQITFICAAVDQLVPFAKGESNLGKLRSLADIFAAAAMEKFEGFKGRHVAISPHYSLDRGIMAVFTRSSSEPPFVMVKDFAGTPLEVRSDLLRHETPHRESYLGFLEPYLPPANPKIIEVDTRKGGGGQSLILILLSPA